MSCYTLGNKDVFSKAALVIKFTKLIIPQINTFQKPEHEREHTVKLGFVEDISTPVSYTYQYMIITHISVYL